MVLIGGLQGVESNPAVYIYEINTNAWSIIKNFTVNNSF